MPQPFNNAVMTNGGARLLTRAQAGEIKIEFTRIAIGSGSYTAAEKALAALQARTELKERKNSYTLSDIDVYSEHSVKVTALITNQDPVTKETLVNQGYYINEMGLYAKPAGESDSAEVLYSVTVTAGENGDFMPPYNGYNAAQIIQDYYVTVNNSAQITINTTGAPALAEDLQEIKRQLGEYIVKSDVPESAIFANMVGATAETAGAAGYVPAPGAGKQETYLRGDGTWQQAFDSLAAVRANTRQGYIAGALALKEAAGTIMTDTLAAGATTLIFTNSAITDDSLIDIYTDNAEAKLSKVDQSENTLTLTFDKQTTAVGVKVRVI